MGLELSLSPGAVVTTTDSNEDISSEKVGKVMQNSMNAKRIDTIKDQKWQGKLIQTRWIDTDLVDCFSCLYRWQLAPTNTIAGLFELYQQLVPTKLYNQNKTRTDTTSDAMCRMCHESPESVAHVIAGCSALAQTKYVARHNGALKILFFELLDDLDVIESVPPWYSPTTPKPEYHNTKASAFWDVPVFAGNTEVRANRIDVRIVENETETVKIIEMSCPWIENKKQKNQEKTTKYAPLRWELKQQHKGYTIKQYNIIIDVLGGYSSETREKVILLLGKTKADKTLFNMQKAVISSTLNITRSFKVLS